MALVGNLKDLKLANLIQLNCMERNNAKLTIDYAGKYGTIYFQGGQVVHAELDPDLGEKAIYRMLSLEEGKFKVESGVRAPAETITTSWSNLLLEGLQQKDDRLSSDDAKNQELLGMLMNVKGVIRAAVLTLDGNVISSDYEAEKEFSLSAFSALQIGYMSESAEIEYPKYISLVVGQTRMILHKRNDEIIYIEIAARFQIDTILPFIKKVMAGDSK
jgi:predicted regulator of Ras-like GTPase activity (Roadblock/LC7/MglB family)